jgi:hypothetical protein
MSHPHKYDEDIFQKKFLPISVTFTKIKEVICIVNRYHITKIRPDSRDHHLDTIKYLYISGIQYHRNTVSYEHRAIQSQLSLISSLSHCHHK